MVKYQNITGDGSTPIRVVDGDKLGFWVNASIGAGGIPVNEFAKFDVSLRQFQGIDVFSPLIVDGPYHQESSFLPAHFVQQLPSHGVGSSSFYDLSQFSTQTTYTLAGDLRYQVTCDSYVGPVSIIGDYPGTAFQIKKEVAPALTSVSPPAVFAGVPQTFSFVGQGWAGWAP